MEKKQYETKKEWAERWDKFFKKLWGSGRAHTDDRFICPECTDEDPICTHLTVSDLFNHVQKDHHWTPPPENCNSCKFSVHYEKGNLVVCKRSSPQINFTLEKLTGYWPSVHESQWCGEWKEKDNG